MMSTPRSGRLQFDRFSGLYLWALFIVVFTVWRPQTFPTMNTVHAVASTQAVGTMLAIAILVPLAAGVYDLSAGAVINFSTILVSVLQTVHGWAMWPSIGVTIGCCLLIGVVNGFIVVRLGVNSFIATLGAAAIIGALQSVVTGQQQPLPPQADGWSELTQRSVLGFQIVVLYMFVLAFVVWWALAHTPAGRYVQAVGGNAEAARLSGVAVGRWTWLSLICSATIGGLAGVCYASLSGPSLAFGPGLLLPAFAAAFLGSTQLQPGRFNVWGTILAVFVLATGVKGLQLVTSVQWLSDMFNGVALVAAVAFAVSRQRHAVERRRKGLRAPTADNPRVGLAEAVPAAD